MAIIGGPRIVTRGLTCLLDSQNPKSYISGSPLVVDLSQNGNSAVLMGALQWSATGGWTAFTSTAYLLPPSSAFNTVKTAPGGSGYTTMAWATVSGASNGGSWAKLCGQADGDNYIDVWASNVAGVRLYHAEGGEALQVNASAVPNDSFPLAGFGWAMLTATNGSSGTTGTPTTQFRIGSDQGNSAFLWPGNISMFAFYSGVQLTPAELLQNYNAFRSRYGR